MSNREIKVEVEFFEDYFTFPQHGLISIGFEADCEFYRGELAAHDLIEHLNGIEKIGPVEDELQAIAASWYCRAQFGDRITFEGLASDIANNLTYCEHRDLKEAPIDLEKFAKKWDCEYKQFEILVAEAREKPWNEISEQTNRNYTRALGWLCEGYRRTEERYPDAAAMNGLFHAVKDYFDNRLKDFIYATLNVTINLSTYEIRDNLQQEIFGEYDYDKAAFT